MRVVALAPVALLALPLSAAAEPPSRNADNHCMSQVETVVFHCQTTRGKWVSVCADAQSATPGFVQYRYGSKGKIELQKPDVSTQNLAAWTHSSQMLARGESRSVKFINDGYGYEVFVTEAGIDTTGGVVVSQGDKALATLTCANQEWTENFAVVKQAKEAAKPATP